MHNFRKLHALHLCYKIHLLCWFDFRSVFGASSVASETLKSVCELWSTDFHSRHTNFELV